MPLVTICIFMKILMKMKDKQLNQKYVSKPLTAGVNVKVVAA